MHIEIPKWEQIRTWVTSHNALSRSEVSAQLKNNFKHVIGHNGDNHAWQLNQSINQL